MHNNIPKKVIRIPPTTLVDISKYSDIINEPVFQDLREKKQLGLVGKLFPGGVHTRFEHSLGTLHLTQVITRHLELGQEEARLLELLGLLHDVGHGPYSHQVEPLIEDDDHEARGLRIVSDLKGIIGKIVDYERFAALYDKKDPLSQVVFDRNLGSDKLDYLFRDAYHIGFSGCPDISQIIKYLIYDNGKLGVEEKIGEEVMDMQRHYAYMHSHIYLRKQSVINQRILQRAVEEMLDGGLVENETGFYIYNLNDAGFEETFRTAKRKLARELYNRLRFRDTLKTAVVFKIAGYAKSERVAGKPIAVFELSEEEMKKFAEKYRNVRNLSELEDDIAKQIGISQGELLIATMPFIHRIVPTDIMLYSQNDGRWHSLFEKYPHHKTMLDNDYSSAFAIRVVTTEEKREYACKKAEVVKENILKQIK